MESLSNTDVDNVAKFILDCMNGLAFKDDNQIKTLIVRKSKCSKKLKGRIGVRISKCH